MRKRIPVLVGFMAGLAYGLYLIFFVPFEQIPGFIGACVGGLGELLSGGGSEAFTFLFVMCGVPMFCAGFGAALGFAAGLLFKKVRTHGSL
jgi:hypothetical protein